jgi:hypothetical protein
MPRRTRRHTGATEHPRDASRYPAPKKPGTDSMARPSSGGSASPIPLRMSVEEAEPDTAVPPRQWGTPVPPHSPTRRRASDGPVTVWGKKICRTGQAREPLSSPGRPSPKPPTCPAVGDRGMVMRLHGRRSRSNDHPGQYARWMRSTAGRGDRARRRGRRPTRPAEAATNPGQGSDLGEHRRNPSLGVLPPRSPSSLVVTSYPQYSRQII